MRVTAVIWPVLGLSCLLACGCATQPAPATSATAGSGIGADDNNDPYEPTNRKFYAVNDALDRNVMHPVASAYNSVVPGTVRTHLHNVLNNLGNPTQLANDMLQGKPRKAGNTLMRLLINTTLGFGGVFDLAADWGWPDHDTDFGLTLAVWGVPDGPYLFLPVLGPSDFRDATGYGVNTALDPLTWVSFSGSATLGWARFGTGAVDGRARHLDVTDSIQKTALDPYATYRSLWQQHRESAASDAQVDLPRTDPWSGSTAPSAPPQEIKAVVTPGLAPPAALNP